MEYDDNNSKEIEEDFYSLFMQYKTYDVKNPLLKGWKWIIYNDGSGYLEDTCGNHCFIFDWNTTEYKYDENSVYHMWGIKDDDGNPISFEDFQQYAEEYVLKNNSKLSENIKEIRRDEEEEYR